MKNSKRLIGAVTLIASLGFVAMPAMAASATMTGCLKTAKDVRHALDKNQNSPKYDQADKLRSAGLQFCNAGMYKQGVARYSAALKLLGAGNAAAAASDRNG